ncbi:MAG: hypothetical protein ABW252_16690 [Polyangiales bacterium]
MREGRAQYAIACVALYALLVGLHAAGLGHAPSALDDRSQLVHVAGKSLGALLTEGDAFGHFRPLKNLLFAGLVDAPGRVLALRVGLLALLIGTAELLRRLTIGLTGAPWVGLASAALWALHPATAGVVCWLSTANLLIALALMLAYLIAVEREVGWAALLALGLALAAHELACVAPLLAWASLRARARPLPQLRSVVALGSLLTVSVYAVLHLLRAAPTHAYRTETPAWQLTLSAARYFFTHVGTWLAPYGSFGVLRTDQPEAHVGLNIACWALAIGAAIVAWRWRGRDRVLGFAGVWVALTLLPVCNLVPIGNTPLALHYLCLPAVGLALGCARAAQRIDAARPGCRVGYVQLASFVVALTWVPETVHTVAAWENEETLYRATLANHPSEVEVLSNLGSYYLGEQRLGDARLVLDEARALAPDDRGVVINLFALALEEGKPAEALARIDAHPARDDDPDLTIRRGEALELLGRDADAAEAFGRGYEAAGARGLHEPRYLAGYRRLVALVRLGRMAEAEALLARMLAEFPGRQELQIARRLLDEE